VDERDTDEGVVGEPRVEVDQPLPDGAAQHGLRAERERHRHTEQDVAALDRLRRAQPEAVVGRRLGLHRQQPVAARVIHPLAERRQVREPRVVLAGDEVEDRD